MSAFDTCKPHGTGTRKLSNAVKTSTAIHAGQRRTFIDIYFTVSSRETSWTVAGKVVHHGYTSPSIHTWDRHAHISYPGAIPSLIAW